MAFYQNVFFNKVCYKRDFSLIVNDVDCIGVIM